MMRKTVDKTKEIIENIKKLSADNETDLSKAALSLEKHGLNFVSVFLENYDSFNMEIIMKAIKASLNIHTDENSKKDAKILDSILKRLVVIYANEKNDNMVSMWLTMLGKYGNVHTIPVIARSLLSEDKRIRANAVEAIGNIGGGQVKELLLPYLKDSSNRVKANTAIALWEFNELRSVVKKAFDEMIVDRDKWMKASAFYAFGEIKADEFVQILLNSIDDSDEDICKNAFLALVGYAEQYSGVGDIAPEKKPVKLRK